MKQKRIKNILWDFDGVILDSMPIRDFGFKQIFKKFKREDVDELLTFHKKNGGLSRYVKIRHFFENILGEVISDEDVLLYANSFSAIMRKRLVDKSYLIEETVAFIRNNTENFNFHIVSGSDQKELRHLCKELGIADLFLSISGSPTPKNDLVKDLLLEYKYERKKCCLIGDSINDFEAAKINNIDFVAYNNESLEKFSTIDLKLSII